jgi:putative ABC transport system substrate-binding protein
LTAFRQGLKENNYVEGQNVAIAYRWADGHYDRLPALAADLARLQVRVIFASANVSAFAAKAATVTIPIVFAIGGDPVRMGFVNSFSRPGGNLTGVSFLINVLEAKKLQLLHEVVSTSMIAALLNPTNPIAGSQSKELQEAALGLGLQVLVLNASSERELETAFASSVERGAGALLVTADPSFTSHRDQIVSLAARHAIPTLYHRREFTAAGGLMSYGTKLSEAHRQAGVYAGKILKGEKPGDLPIVQSTKFEFVINLNTARALGVKISDNLLSIADEVIE